MHKSILREKTLCFSISISKFTIKLKEKKLFEISSQLFRSATSIGANIMEARGAQSRKDFISKLEISLKEAYETYYRLEILESGYDINVDTYKISNREILKLLVASIKTLKNQ